MLKAMVMTAVLMVAGAASAQTAPVWQTIQGADEAVKYQAVPLAGGAGFRALVIFNRPPSDIVGAPESMMVNMEASCSSRTFVIDSFVNYSGKMGSGFAVQAYTGGFDFERVERRVQDGSAVAEVFGVMCK